MGDYFAHWLELGRDADPAKLPQIFYVNWFRRDEDGRFLWPGFGENSRVLEWVFGRCAGDEAATAVETAIGWVPKPEGIETDGLDLSPRDMAKLLAVDDEEWQAEVPSIKEHFAAFGDHLPKALTEELATLEQHLG
jgi:phosphoenolpyruvate carboxykinase (GTP)